ncbi:MAG: helix-turn-helix domain-containing protein [Polaromonas sp.]
MKKSTSRVIPSYALYGDQAQPGWQNSFDFEWIPQRSGPYNWEIRPHVHEAFIQILYLTQGVAEVQLDNAKWRVPAPCLLIVPAQTVHGFHFSSDVNGPVVTATQRPLESLAALAMPELLQTLRKPAVISLNDDGRHAEALMPLFLAIEREARLHAMGQFAAGMSLLTALFVQVARLDQAKAPAPLAVSLRKTGQIEKFRTLVNDNFKKHLPMAFYAGQLGVTPGQLSRLCREVLGSSSLEVINARIVHEAQRDLVFTSSSIQQLADTLGFGDEAYFGRFFRKHTGLTPREFRARALQSMLKPDSWPAVGAEVLVAP